MNVDWFWFIMGMTFSFIFEIMVGVFITGRIVQWYLTKHANKILYSIINNMSEDDKKKLRQWILGMFGFQGGRPQKFSLTGLIAQFLPLIFGQPPIQQPPQQPIQ